MQLFFTRAPYCDVLVWRQNVPQSVKDRARGFITGIFSYSIYNGIICGYLMFLLIYSTVKRNCKASIKLNMASIWRLRMYVIELGGIQNFKTVRYFIKYHDINNYHGI